MTNARQKILNYLLEQRSATVEELSRVFRVTPANIRHHLSILTTQGSVKVIGLKAPAYRGRPSQIYSCTQRERNNLEKLAEILLSNILLRHGEKEISQQLKDIACQMVANFPLDRTNPTRRFYSSIQILNRMNYQAHWEAHIENPRIMLGHCPYSTLQGRIPVICQMDASILEELLGTPVKQVEKLVLNDKCLPQCVFLLDKSTS
jgi:predicted ArsR family transcriptional regulator